MSIEKITKIEPTRWVMYEWKEIGKLNGGGGRVKVEVDGGYWGKYRRRAEWYVE